MESNDINQNFQEREKFWSYADSVRDSLRRNGEVLACDIRPQNFNEMPRRVTHPSAGAISKDSKWPELHKSNKVREKQVDSHQYSIIPASAEEDMSSEKNKD